MSRPITADERKLMIKESLEELNVKKYKVVLIPDIHNYTNWVDYVVSIVPDFDVVITNSNLTKDLFSEKGHVVKGTSMHNPGKFSGEEIRRRIINDEPWDDLVPEPVYKIIRSINGINRLKRLSKKI